MRTCDEITALISASLDGALSEQEQIELDAHLAACPACSALYAQLNQLHEDCAGLEELSAPEGFSARVMECIAANPAQEQPTNVIPFPTKKAARSPWKRWGVTAAAVAIVVLGAVSLPGQLGGVTKQASNGSRDVADMAAPAEYSVADSEAQAEMPATDEYIELSEAKPEMAPAEPEAPAAPAPMPSALPQASPDSDANNRDKGYNTPNMLGTLTFTAEDAPAGLDQFDVLTSADGTKTYTVSAEFFFTLESSKQFDGYPSTETQYGLVIVTP